MTLPVNGNVQPIEGDPNPNAVPVKVAGKPGVTITSEVFVAVGAGLTVDLPVPPANTRCMVVQVVIGSSLTNVLVREKGGTAGTGRLLIIYGSTLFGGADGAVEQLECQNIAGPDAQISVTFEGD